MAVSEFRNVSTKVSFRNYVWLGVAFGVSAVEAIGAAGPGAGASDVGSDSTLMAPVKVTGERLEDFGLRVSPRLDGEHSTGSRRVYVPVVDAVLPNTAASKAGVRPGDRILVSDGESVATESSSSSKWRSILTAKWNEVIKAKSGVTWTLQVEAAGTSEKRLLQLQLPTPPPHWGATVWRAPTERTAIVVPEPGPLAERAQDVLNNGIWMVLRTSYVRGFQFPLDAAHPQFLCYQWTLWSGSLGHRMYVSRQRGRTDIIFEVISHEAGGWFSRFMPAVVPDRSLASMTTAQAIDSRTYLTSPSGELERAWRLPLTNEQKEIPLGAARAGFEAEVDFWLTKVGKVSPLWPLEVIGSPTRSSANADASLRGRAPASGQ
jgi:hypothetical protein